MSRCFGLRRCKQTPRPFVQTVANRSKPFANRGFIYHPASLHSICPRRNLLLSNKGQHSLIRLVHFWASPYSGPASLVGVTGRSTIAYYKALNDRGGVNGRKINLLNVDDAYSPPKTVEQVRRLVEHEGVLGMFGSVGAAPNIAVQRYLNERRVPHFLSSPALRASAIRRPFHGRWVPTSALLTQRQSTRDIFLLNPGVAVLYQNDDFGKDHLAGLRRGFGNKADTAIVKTASFEVTDATVDSQIIELKACGANVLLTAAIAKFAA
jgi:branched-chain amino acid transport system substrate-binding protein